jgi:hypothetical protein
MQGSKEGPSPAKQQMRVCHLTSSFALASDWLLPSVCRASLLVSAQNEAFPADGGDCSCQ